MAREAYLKKNVTSDEGTMNYTPSSAVVAGEVVKVNISSTQAIAGVATQAIAASATGPIDITNIYALTCASGQAFAEGAQVYWDHEGNKAIPAASSNGTDDFFVGTCVKTSTGSWVWVRLNFGPSEFVRESSSSSSSSSSS